MPGRKPVPTHLKLLKGNPGKRPINKNEPIPRGHLKDPPEWLSAEQKLSWCYAIEHAPRGLLKKLDRSVLVIWVVAENLHRQASISLERYGMLTKSPIKGVPTQNPYLPILNRQAVMMLKAASELGFSPTARVRVSVADEDQDENPFNAF